MKAERGWDNAPRPGYAAPMSTSPTVLVVGSGLTGSTVARALARADVSSVELAQGAMVVNHPGREALDVSDEVLATLRVTA